jgi:putative oxidoreductase
MLSILRIMVGLLYMEHGLAKVWDFPHQPNHAPDALFPFVPGLQGLLELVGGLLLALGLFTRPVAFVLAGNMAVAYFMAHAPRGFFPLLNGGELAIVYCFVFLYFWVAGGGEWGLDRHARRRLRPRYRRAGPDHHRLRQWCSPDLRRNCYRSCRTVDASMRGDQEERCGLGNFPLV